MEKRIPHSLLSFFQYGHLRESLQKVARPIGQLAMTLDEMLPDGAEKTVALRKLLEAKDCAVRSYLLVEETTAPKEGGML